MKNLIVILLSISNVLFSEEKSVNPKGKFETITVGNHWFLVIFLDGCSGANVLHHPDCPCNNNTYHMIPKEKTATGVLIKLEKVVIQ